MEVIENGTHTNGTPNQLKEEGENEVEGIYKKTINILGKPLEAVFYISIPDCRKEPWSRWYIVTLTMSILWISIFSYILIWMITIIGTYILYQYNPTTILN